MHDKDTTEYESHVIYQLHVYDYTNQIARNTQTRWNKSENQYHEKSESYKHQNENLKTN